MKRRGRARRGAKQVKRGLPANQESPPLGGPSRTSSIHAWAGEGASRTTASARAPGVRRPTSLSASRRSSPPRRTSSARSRLGPAVRPPRCGRPLARRVSRAARDASGNVGHSGAEHCRGGPSRRIATRGPRGAALARGAHRRLAVRRAAPPPIWRARPSWSRSIATCRSARSTPRWLLPPSVSTSPRVK